MSYTGCWLCVDTELAIGGARSLGSDQPLAPPAEDVKLARPMRIAMIYSFEHQKA